MATVTEELAGNRRKETRAAFLDASIFNSWSRSGSKPEPSASRSDLISYLKRSEEPSETIWAGRRVTEGAGGGAAPAEVAFQSALIVQKETLQSAAGCVQQPGEAGIFPHTEPEGPAQKGLRFRPSSLRQDAR